MKPLVNICYGRVMALRRWLYRIGARCPYRPQAAVISVGNITAGGAGKSSVALYLAELLGQQSVAILLRGYKSPAERSVEPTVCTPAMDWRQIGDEAACYVRRAPQAMVIAGRERARACAIADARGAQVIVLDDGMQHLQVARDLEICVVDAIDPLGQLRREPPAAWRQADLLLLHRVDCVADGGVAATACVRRYTSAPIVQTRLVAQGIYDLEGREVVGLQRVALLCGIGQPAGFMRLVESMGLQVVDRMVLRDHAKASDADLEPFMRRAREAGAEAVVCTEKDAVKYRNVPLLWLKVSLQIVEGEAALQQAVAALRPSRGVA